MKKVILALVAVCVTVAGFSIGNTAQAAINTSELDCYGGTGNMRCVFCGGSGWQGNFTCFHCKGTGRNQSY